MIKSLVTTTCAQHDASYVALCLDAETLDELLQVKLMQVQKPLMLHSAMHHKLHVYSDLGADASLSAGDMAPRHQEQRGSRHLQQGAKETQHLSRTVKS